MKPRILITGAAGNLGSLLARSLVDRRQPLRLMVHRTGLPQRVMGAEDVQVARADLGDPATLAPAVAGVDVAVHFAGVLFAPHPERFLPTTNTGYFSNLVDACLAARVRRIVLVSFPQVEGETSPEHPATGRLDRAPTSVHARTRLEEERLLIGRTAKTRTTPVVLRCGMVYGRGILMIEAARWLARRRLLAVWPEPTTYQLLSTPDFLAATTAAALNPRARGIYHAGDEWPVTIQQFLDEACRLWGYARPWRFPFGMIEAAAAVCEALASIFRTKAPLTREFVRLGRVSHWGDTTRFRRELLPKLAYPTFEAGKATLV